MNQIQKYRKLRKWSQAELAKRTGLSRTAISAIEQQRLSPSVASALTLASVFNCTVEELFSESEDKLNVDWAFDSWDSPCRYWLAEVNHKIWRYPAEQTHLGMIPHHGVFDGTQFNESNSISSDKVLVIASCDPAIGLLASLYAQQTPYQLLPLSRSSKVAIQLLQEGKVHLAGLHLAKGEDSAKNHSIAQEICQDELKLLRMSIWQEGIAVDPRLKVKSVRAASSSKLQWVGREKGSGAHLVQTQVLKGKKTPRRVAPDHRGVALAIKSGWADVGICLKIASEEAGLGFIEIQSEAYDLCFLKKTADDPRVRALIRVVRSKEYRQLMGDLPGYQCHAMGELL